MDKKSQDKRIAADILIAALSSNESSGFSLYTSDKDTSENQATNIAAAYKIILKAVSSSETSD